MNEGGSTLARPSALERLLSALGDACLLVGADGRIIAANDTAARLYGHPADELVGLTVEELCSDRHRDAIISRLFSCGDEPCQFSLEQVRADGSLFVGEFSAKRCDAEEDLTHLLVVREAELAACEADREIKDILLQASVDGIIAHDPEGNVVYANDAALRQYGMTMAELRAAGPFAWVASEFRPHVQERLAVLRDHGEHLFESTTRRPDGTVTPTEIHARLVDTPVGELVVSISRDMTDRIRTEEMVRYLAYHDMLTGLANRVLFETELATAISTSDRQGDLAGVAFFDLDTFKPVNDTHGHTIGDHVLREVADRIAANVRDTDVVARLGGDEFVVLFNRLSTPADLPRIAKCIAEEIARPMTISGRVLRVSASVGIALHKQGEDADTFLTRADLAMYESRATGTPGWELVELG